MSRTSIYLLTSFSLVTLIAVGCGPEKTTNRQKIRPANANSKVQAKDAPDSANGVKDAGFGTGETIPEAKATRVSPEEAATAVSSIINGTTAMTLETLEAGQYQLESYIFLAQKNGMQESFGFRFDVKSVDGKVELVDTTQFQGAQTASTKRKGETEKAPLKTAAFGHQVSREIPVSFEVSVNIESPFKVSSSMILDRVKNSKGDFAISPRVGSADGAHFVTDIMSTNKTANAKGLYEIKQQKFDSYLLQFRKKDDKLIVNQQQQISNKKGFGTVNYEVVAIYKNVASTSAGAPAPAAAAAASDGGAAAPAPVTEAKPATLAPAADAGASATVPAAVPAAASSSAPDAAAQPEEVPTVK